jgi:hypothetical protein
MFFMCISVVLKQLLQKNSIFAVIFALLFLFYSSVFSICVRAHLDVDIQARNSEMLFVLVQFSCLGGRGIVTWILAQISSGICNTCATHPNFPRLQARNLMESTCKC